jgi:hypothetical protein
VSVLDFVFVVALLTAVVAVPFLLIGWSNSLSERQEARPFPIKSTLFFAVPIIIGWLIYLISTSIAQFKARQFLESVSDKCIVAINGNPVQNRNEILNTLRSVADLPTHHSSPTHMIDVDLSDPPRHLSLWVARDSSDRREYWVFAPSPSKLGLRASLKKDIGHVITPVFDQY